MYVSVDFDYKSKEHNINDEVYIVNTGDASIKQFSILDKGWDDYRNSWCYTVKELNNDGAWAEKLDITDVTMDRLVGNLIYDNLNDAEQCQLATYEMLWEIAQNSVDNYKEKIDKLSRKLEVY